MKTFNDVNQFDLLFCYRIENDQIITIQNEINVRYATLRNDKIAKNLNLDPDICRKLNLPETCVVQNEMLHRDHGFLPNALISCNPLKKEMVIAKFLRFKNKKLRKRLNYE